jgi:hypothetical protein
MRGTVVYRERSDGKVELVTETPEGSTAEVVENVRGRLIPQSRE